MNRQTTAAEVPTVAEVVGRRLRELRREKGFLTRQEDVARVMSSRVGMPWTQATVAGVELGYRDISVEELIALSITCAVPLHDWFAGEGVVKIGPGTTATRKALRALFGSGEDAPLDEWDMPELRLTRELQQWGAEHEDEIIEALTHGVLAGVWPDHKPVPDARAAVAASRGDAEIKASRALTRRLGFKIKPLEVSLIAHALWSRALTAERDGRVADRTPEGTAPRTLQAIRGHVTRELLDEIAQAIPGQQDDEADDTEGAR